MREPTSKPVKTNSVDSLKLSWRDHKYHRFYTVVDQLVDELQEHVWAKSGKPKRRLKGDGSEKLHYSMGFSVLIFFPWPNDCSKLL